MKTYDVQGQGYQWALRANIVIDKHGIVGHMEEGDSAVNPNNAVAICKHLHREESTK